LTNIPSGAYGLCRHVMEDAMNVEFWVEVLLFVAKLIAAGCRE
jgi:hypothetical protein